MYPGHWSAHSADFLAAGHSEESWGYSPFTSPSIGVSLRASHVDITWNSFLPYLINLADKLESLGFRYVDGSVIVNKEEK